MIDTDREKDIGLGTTYNFSAMGEGRCLVNYQMAETLQVRENDIVYMRLNMYQNLLTLVDVYNSMTNGTKLNKNDIKSKIRNVKVNMPCNISIIGDSSYGKFPQASAPSQILMEYGPSVMHLSKYLPEALNITEFK